MPPQSLWPPDIVSSVGSTPLAIVREQALLLAQMTDDTLLAGVIAAGGDGRSLEFDFNIAAPALKDYRYLLFSFKHRPTDPYPVEIYNLPGDERVVGNSEEELRAILKDIFASEETRRVVGSLYAISKQV